MSTSIPPSRRNSPRHRTELTRHQHPLDRVVSFTPKRKRAGAGAVSRPVRQPGRSQTEPLVRPSRFRLLLVWFILTLGGLGLTINLFRLQVVQAPMLRERAQEQQILHLLPFVPRRPIIDRLGNVLAIDQPVFTLYAHPILFKVPLQTVADQLAPLLQRPASALVSQFSQAESGILLNEAVSEDVTEKILDLQLDGLELIKHQQRLYPQQSLFANVVGYVNVDRDGQVGVEASHEEQLERSLSAMQLRRMGNGAIVPENVPDELLHQDDLRLQLTLDSRLQRTTQVVLHRQMEHYGAKRGTVMVMDVHTGEMLAFVSQPTFDPNQYYESDTDFLGNWAVSDLYEPGSTFKPINVAIALEAGAVQPNDSFNDEGRITIGGWPIQNSDFNEHGGRGTLSIREILKYSSNVGMVRIMQQMDAATYYNWMEKLGIGESTQIDLPAETVGQMKSVEQFTSASIEPATTAFGQGFSLTPIQLLQLHGAIANGGKLVTPHVARGLVNTNGQLQWQPDLPEARSLFSLQTTQTVLDMMETAVQEGTGKSARIPGYRIAGKTGTAQKASPDGGYLASARITSFVGTFPVDTPRYTILVVIDEPQGEDAYGSTVAAPIAKAVMEALITLEQILPSQPISQESVATDSNETEPDSAQMDQSYLEEPSYEEPLYEEPLYEEPLYEEPIADPEVDEAAPEAMEYDTETQW
ncbi:penicillin-binding protein 2 [Oculatella sp. LEGE 06141]|uniref:peptidoglycan D,D-transpeptidase FtsI family protein n=1 Tax=Oculatella sp. LEGE 06141 TaxID=1828648 RepID=UPI001880685A|nr:penicillin-binding protein 2 [Oculatella sp. LEGE 06141]MBE9180390.1 penicillin-binding protein 2 [Oculatella sp. LEGE 06141]